MKLLFCGRCMDIRSLDPHGRKTSCHCGNMTARWENPQQGTVRVSAKDPSMVRIIGMHNSFLHAAFKERLSNQEWKDFHELLTCQAEGYLFHDQKRACWAAIVRVGESSDIFWESEEETVLSDD